MGTPRYWMVVLLVVAVMSVWALAVAAASARSRKHNQTLIPFPCKTGAETGAPEVGEKTCAHTAVEAVVRVEDLIFVPFPS